MHPRKPSRTAFSAAAHRAVHAIVDEVRVFEDPLAFTILAEDRDAVVRDALAHPERRLMRLFIAARTRFAEDAAAGAIAREVGQVVILGAGLDTFGYRHPYAGVQVFEVDHPATQAWKRRQLSVTGITVPAAVTYVPLDFENASVISALTASGFEAAHPAIFLWLGVVPYLTSAAVLATLTCVADLPRAEIVFDYPNPPDSLAGAQRDAHLARAARVAALGEPWITYFDSEQLVAHLVELGFDIVEDLGPAEIAARYFGGPANAPRRTGGHVIHAARSTQ